MSDQVNAATLAILSSLRTVFRAFNDVAEIERYCDFVMQGLETWPNFYPSNHAIIELEKLE